jgi:hypothetical protein
VYNLIVNNEILLLITPSTLMMSIQIKIYLLFLFINIAHCVEDDDTFNWLKEGDNIVPSKYVAMIEATQKEQHKEAQGHSIVSPSIPSPQSSQVSYCCC